MTLTAAFRRWRARRDRRLGRVFHEREIVCYRGVRLVRIRLRENRSNTYKARNAWREKESIHLPNL
jgi:hypothetical protein